MSKITDDYKQRGIKIGEEWAAAAIAEYLQGSAQDIDFSGIQPMFDPPKAENGISMRTIMTEIERQGILEGIWRIFEKERMNIEEKAKKDGVMAVTKVVRTYNQTGSVLEAAKSNGLTEEEALYILQRSGVV